MKLTVIIMWCIVILMVVIQVYQNIIADYKFENKYLYAWNLADKSSTIEAKLQHISKFVELLGENQKDFSSHNAQFMTTPDNSFEENFKALKTLHLRLKEIVTMDVKSFEYQTAIQQITAQEQGEATKLIHAIHGCWIKNKYPIIWRWYQSVWITTWVIFGITAFILTAFWLLNNLRRLNG